MPITSPDMTTARHYATTPYRLQHHR